MTIKETEIEEARWQPLGEKRKWGVAISDMQDDSVLEQGSPTARMRTSKNPRPVRTRATQQEVSSG